MKLLLIFSLTWLGLLTGAKGADNFLQGIPDIVDYEDNEDVNLGQMVADHFNGNGDNDKNDAEASERQDTIRKAFKELNLEELEHWDGVEDAYSIAEFDNDDVDDDDDEEDSEENNNVILKRERRDVTEEEKESLKKANARKQKRGGKNKKDKTKKRKGKKNINAKKPRTKKGKKRVPKKKSRTGKREPMSTVASPAQE